MAFSVPPASLQPTPAADPAAQATAADKRAHIAKTARAFESSYLSVMLNQMFEGVSGGPFGGPGEAMFKSFLGEAMAKSMTARGGVGLASTVEREMLKMQGLTEAGAAK
jgi:Rod binding domain-containing protein